MSSFDPNKIGMTTAAVFGIIYIACVALFLLIPNQALTLISYVMHGIDITKISMTPRISGTTIIGLIEILLFGYLVGALFASVYNFINKRF